MTADTLREHEGKIGLLRFLDGHTVKARLVHVDPDDRQEVIYDVLEVVATGSQQWAAVRPGTTAVAPLNEVASFTSHDGES